MSRTLFPMGFRGHIYIGQWMMLFFAGFKFREFTACVNILFLKGNGFCRIDGGGFSVDAKKKTQHLPGWRPSVLVLDDEWTTLEVIKSSLVNQFAVEIASRADHAVSLMEARHFDVVLTDVRMPDCDGLSLVKDLKSRFPETQYILMTAFSDIEDTISAIRLGVADYLRKPFTMGEVQHALNRCLERRRLRREVASLRAGKGITLSDILARDQVMARLRDLAETVAPTDVTVLISGETGTGKSVLAKAIHNTSPRCDRPFTEINCAAIPEPLIESELFGHEKGAFTGAVARKIGRVEAAEGGTLLLDEVGEMSLDMQAKLLRFLQEFTFERVGGTKKLSADVRVIAATNRNLRQAVQEGRFREDLYYRLHVIELYLPPLRDRRSDISTLAETFMQRFGIKYDKQVRGLSAFARKQMMEYHWPGNVREMEHSLERAVILCQGSVVEKLDLSHHGTAEADPAAPQDSPGPAMTEMATTQAVDVDLTEYIDSCEKSYLESLLDRYAGRIGQVAKAAGVNPKTLYLKMNRHGLRKEDYRQGRSR